MIAKALEWLKEEFKVNALVVDERNYSTKKLWPVEEPLPTPLNFSTLAGMAEYTKRNPDETAQPDGFLLHIRNPAEVVLQSPLIGDFEQRKTYATAAIPYKPFVFGSWIPVDDFIIALRSLFVQDESTEKIFKVVGNLTDEDVKTLEDDGITQRATVRTGIARIGEKDLPGIVMLRPYRTFPEVEQPASEFLLRIRPGQNVTAALFEADGGRWKLEAVKNIATYFANEGVSAFAMILV